MGFRSHPIRRAQLIPFNKLMTSEYVQTELIILTEKMPSHSQILRLALMLIY